MSITTVSSDDRPVSMMDLLDHHPMAPAATIRRLPNRRALAVLDQMFGYYDAEDRAEVVDLSYDSFAA